jgi:glycerol-3-phosphate acyltransferase PlsY
LISSIFIIIGHNYPIWLKFKGGRGLAAGAGIFILLNFGFVVSWLLIWGIIYSIKKDILVSNFAATFLLPVMVILFKNLSMPFLNPVINSENYSLFVLFTIIISLLVIIKHKAVLNRFIPFTAKNL